MSTDAIQFAGEFAIEELKIVTPTEQVADLISDVLVIEINIFEDIFSNTLSGNIMLTDIRDIITLLPIQGQEELFLKIKNTAPKIKSFSLNKTFKSSKHIPIFILGMPRSGTTLVEQIISSHSNVTGAGELIFMNNHGSKINIDEQSK